jgi:hypothetical protein
MADFVRYLAAACFYTLLNLLACVQLFSERHKLHSLTAHICYFNRRLFWLHFPSLQELEGDTQTARRSHKSPLFLQNKKIRLKIVTEFSLSVFLTQTGAVMKIGSCLIPIVVDSVLYTSQTFPWNEYNPDCFMHNRICQRRLKPRNTWTKIVLIFAVTGTTRQIRPLEPKKLSPLQDMINIPQPVL